MNLKKEWTGTRPGGSNHVCLEVAEVTRDLSLDDVKGMPDSQIFSISSPQINGGKRFTVGLDQLTFDVMGENEDGKYHVEARPMRFNKNMSTDEILAWAQKRGLKPGSKDKMLQFDRTYNMLRPIVTLAHLDECEGRVPIIDCPGVLDETIATKRWEEGIYFFFLRGEW